ncbi:hypothetical protein QUB72_07580 [Enterococcus faecium]|nr:hypothetical protein [Enterococcus faecium]
MRQARFVAPSLTEQEIIEALASVGATKENLVDSAKEVYLLRINKARRMGRPLIYWRRRSKTKSMKSWHEIEN